MPLLAPTASPPSSSPISSPKSQKPAVKLAAVITDSPAARKIPRVLLPKTVTIAFEDPDDDGEISISADIAAEMAKSLIGHVLFLKGQIVLYVLSSRNHSVINC